MKGEKQNMNKFLQKVAKIFLGLSMAAGVGVAIGAGRKDANPASAATRPSASTGVFLIDFYDESKISSTSGTGLSNSNYSSFVKVATGLTATNVVTACSVSGTVRYGMNGGLTLGANNTNAASATFTIGSDYAVNKISIYGAKYDANTLTIGGNNADSGTIANKGTTFANLGNPMVWDNLGGITSIVLSKTSGKRVTAYTLVCEYTAGSSDYVGSLSVSPSTWTGYDSQTLSVSSFTVSGSKNGTAGSVTASDYEYKGIGYMSGGNFVARDANFSSGNPTTADTRLAWKAKYPSTAGGSTYAWAYVTLTVSADGVNSIAISGSMTKTTYNQGDAWDPAGFTVKAYYASAPSTPVDVTSNANLSWTYSPATTASTSTTSVTCTASFGGKSATSSAQSVTINERTNLGGIVSGQKYFLIVGGHVLKAGNDFTNSTINTYTTGDSSTASLSESDAWLFTSAGTADSWYITFGETTYLSTGDSNSGMTTTTTQCYWTVEEGSGSYDGKLLLKHHDTSRYISFTSYTSWIRAYTSVNTDRNHEVSFVKYTAPAIAATINGADDVVMGSSWSPTSVTENVGGATVTGVTFAFAASNGATLTAQNPSTGAFTSSTAGTVTVSGTKSGYTITSKEVTVVDNTPYINLTRTSAENSYTGKTVSITASYGNGVTGLNWTIQSGSVSNVTSSDSGYSAKITGSTGTLTIRATDKGSALYREVSVNVTKTAFTTSPSNASVQEGKTTTLSAALNSGGNVTWSSDDNTIATVGESTGVVTGVKKGSVTITAQSAEDTTVTATCTITVTEAPGEIVITSSEIANFSNSYAERDWTYGSGTAAISGKIKAYKNSDNIQLNHNNTCYFYNVDAIPGYITGITFTKVSGTTDLTAWVGDEVLSSDPADGGTTNTTYTWTFNAADKHSYFRVATSGANGARVFSALTITYEKVQLVDPTSITINDKTAISMDTYGYGKRNLTATVGPVNANDKTVTWGTSDSSVVTVANGVLTPVGVGDAIIYATAVGYVSDQATPALKDSVTVHVTQALYKKATFTPTSTSSASQSDDYLSGGSVSLSATSAGSWNTDKGAIQLGAGKDVTFTISGYAGMKITGIDMVVSSNGNAGAGSLDVTAGGTNVLSIESAAFDDASWNGAFDANPVQLYRDITDYVLSGSQTVVFSFAASVNSLYIHSVSIRYLDYSLEQWCENFLASITCNGTDSITDDSNWNSLGTSFAALDDDLEAIAAGATANKDSDSVIEQAMARYDLILRKYGIGTGAGQHTDFIGRFGEGTVNGPLNPSRFLLNNIIGENTNTVAIIVIISMVSVTAIGGYFFLRKRKENI